MLSHTSSGWRWRKVHLLALLDLAPTYQTPVLFHSARKCNLLLLLRADGGGQLQLGQVMLHGDDPRSSAARSDVQHQNFILGQLAHLALLLSSL